MAIIILDKTKCEICGKLIKEGERVVGFPPFATDEKDFTFFFSDSGFHEDCFLKHPLKDEVLRRLAVMGLL